MAPYNSLRDPFAGSQIHSRSVYPDITRHHRSSGNPMLMSASMRAASSPRLVHGNSPLLNAVNVTPVSEEIDTFASPGQFSDAELDKEATSPSSKALQDQLQSATRALEELKEAVRLRRNKRYSLIDSSRQKGRGKESCIDTECQFKASTTGLGLGLDLEDLQPKVEASPQTSHPEAPTPWQAPADLPIRRHWLSEAAKEDCISTTKKWSSKATQSQQTFSSQTVASPTMMSSAPPTPSLEAAAFTTAPTPVMPSSTYSSDGSQGQGQDGSSYFSSSHHNGNHATAIASIGAAGSLLVLAALLLAVYFRKQRSKKYKAQMDSVLAKVSPLPPPSNGGDKEKQEGTAIGSDDFFLASCHKEFSTHSPEEYRTVPPWLSLNMGSHPFANITTKERYSHDLADSGLVGQQGLSKDYSFNWNFPKLSVPPAAARAISTGHYVKKRATVVTRISSGEMEKQVNPSASSSPATRRCSSIQEDADVMSQSASSECVDPEIDHRRKSFNIMDASAKPLVWIKSAFRSLTPNQQSNEECQVREGNDHIDTSSISSPWIPSISSRPSISTSSDERSLSLSMQKSTTSFPHFVPDSLALTQAVVEQVLEIRLPSLSIANSPMLDIKETTLSSFSSKQQQAARMPSIKWSSNNKPSPRRSFSSGSDGSAPAAYTTPATQGSRRVSWAGPLETCREDSKESILDVLRSTEKVMSKMSKIRQSRVWAANDMTDTEDESKEGYEAEEEEIETEVEADMPSTPVITLTCSEEEGRFERRISMSSMPRDGSSNDDHYSVQQQHIKKAAMMEFSSSDDDDDDDDDAATVIVHSFHSADEDANDTDSCHLHSLLVDDFPTIPEWTPMPAPPRQAVH